MFYWNSTGYDGDTSFLKITYVWTLPKKPSAVFILLVMELMNYAKLSNLIYTTVQEVSTQVDLNAMPFLLKSR